MAGLRQEFKGSAETDCWGIESIEELVIDALARQTDNDGLKSPDLSTEDT